MIRINLLPIRSTQQREAAIRQLAGAGIGLMMILLGCWYVNMLLSGQIEEAQAANRTLEQDIQRLKEIIGEVEETDKKKQALQKKLDIIKTLKAQKTGPVHMLDEIASNIPEKCWLTSLSEVNRKVTVTGISINNEVIADFISKLERSGYFDDVYLVSTQQREDKDGLKLKEFQVTARMTTPDEKQAIGTGGAANEDLDDELEGG